MRSEYVEGIPLAPTIRRARIDECDRLTKLTFRSKAHWGYDDAFMASIKSELEVRPAKFEPDFHVYVLEENGKLLGFCSLIPTGRETVEMEDLFLEPAYIGKGYGKMLWDFSVNLARELGYTTLTLVAEPFAEPFYARQGAVRTGEKRSAFVPGRTLPLMEYRLSK